MVISSTFNAVAYSIKFRWESSNRFNKSNKESPNCEESLPYLTLQKVVLPSMSLMFYYVFFELIMKVGT